MLTLTETASAVVRTIAAEASDAADGGLRIAGTEEAGTDFVVSLAPAPEPADQVVERDGAKVFLEPTAALMLDDKVLDAQVATDGSVRFAIGDQTA